MFLSIELTSIVITLFCVILCALSNFYNHWTKKKLIIRLKTCNEILSSNVTTESYSKQNKHSEIELNKILFITSNKYKAAEATEIALLNNIYDHFKVISCCDIPHLQEIHEIQDFDVETVSIDKVKKMYDEIAKLINFKAKNDKSTKLIIVCEDTGLYLEGGYMHGFPGAFFKQFCDTVGNDVCKIHANCKAIARTSVSIYDGKCINTFTGETIGTIIEIPQTGSYGFGFDACFKPDKHDKTFAQMTPEEKNHISMRKIAFSKLFDWYLSTN